MAFVSISNDDLKQLEKFKVECLKCGSTNCEISIDWAAYPSASWNTTMIICKDCHQDELIYESN